MVGKKSFASADVSMLGYGCGVSQYPQLCDKDEDKYQVLPRPYLGSSEVYPGEKFIKEKWVLDLVGQAILFSGNVLKNDKQRNNGLHGKTLQQGNKKYRQNV